MGKGHCNVENVYNVESFTKEDFEVARASWRRNLCGDKDINNITVSGMGNLLQMIDADSREFRVSMNRSLESPVLFGGFIPTESDELKSQYDHLFRLALPYGTYGCTGYKDKAILEDVLPGLEILYRNMYGENVPTDSSFRPYKPYDW